MGQCCILDLVISLAFTCGSSPIHRNQYQKKKKMQATLPWNYSYGEMICTEIIRTSYKQIYIWADCVYDLSMTEAMK